jgi:hypothetical protein
MNLNIKSLSLIFAIVIICAYIFGNVMVSVFKSKLDDYMDHSFKSNHFKEDFKSKKDYHLTTEEEESKSEEENVHISNSQLSKILQEEEKSKILQEEDNLIYKRSILPENIQLNQNMNSEEESSSLYNTNIIYNTNINKTKDLVKEEDSYVIVKKKYVIENFDENKKNKNIIDNEFSKSFGPKSIEPTHINGYDGIPESTSVWNFDYEKHDAIKNLCFHHHIHTKECSYGDTNYADPRTMSVIEKRTFMLNYPSNMTMQDYINWLYSFVGKEDQLPYNHLKNLEKLKKGIPLVKEDGICPPPAQYFPPMDSEKYFKNMYDAKTHEIAFAPKLNSNTSSLVGANYNQYSEFSQNFDLYGSTGSIVNPDIAYKKNAKDLDNIIKPKNGNDLDNEKKYKPYFVKNIEV